MDHTTDSKHLNSLTQSQLQAFEQACTQDEAPACQAACPLHLDVRRFLAHIKAGEWNKGAELLAKSLPFAPLLTSLCGRPCEQCCPRKDFGGPIAVNALERACVRLSRDMPLTKRLPSKGKTVVILGDGIAAFAVAWELSLKGYGVRVLHRGNAPLEGLHAASEAALGSDWRHTGAEVWEYAADTLKRLQDMDVLFAPFAGGTQTIDSLLSTCDGFFVDAASFPAFCPAKEEIDPVTGCRGAEYRICYGGYGVEAILQAFEGRRAALTLGRVMGKSSPTALREGEGPFASRLHVDVEDLAPVPRVLPSQNAFTTEEAGREASRCIPCNCLVCVRECAYLNHFGEYPKVFARQMFLNMGIYTGYRRLNTAINSCALCRQCEALCPEAFSMADLCLLMRREMVQQDKMPPSAHFFALQELAAATAPESVLVMGREAGASCSHVFFPGCQLAAARSNQTRFLFRHLRQTLSPDTGIWLRCCGIPARHAAREDLMHGQRDDLHRQWNALGKPRIILACASCLAFFQEYLPEAQCVSLWEVLDQEAPLPTFPAINAQIWELGIHDPCSARDDEHWQRAVRSLSRKAGATLHEPSASRKTTACCGYGGLVWNANPDMAERMAGHRAAQFPLAVLSSCIMCRDQFVSAGKDSRHMFDLLLPPESWLGLWLASGAPDRPAAEAFADAPGMDAQAGSRKGPGFSRRRENRIRLKKALLETEYGLPAEEEPVQPWALLVDDDILEELERERILREDLTRTILRAEAEGAVFFDRSADRYLARSAFASITFWVCYRKEAMGRRVLDAWLHRMDIELVE